MVIYERLRVIYGVSMQQADFAHVIYCGLRLLSITRWQHLSAWRDLRLLQHSGDDILEK